MLIYFRFKINQKIPRGPPSPPAPILHSPTRKVTVKEQQEWKIPPCISNWKNAKGYTIPLDKRLAADGRGLQQVIPIVKHIYTTSPWLNDVILNAGSH